MGVTTVPRPTVRISTDAVLSRSDAVAVESPLTVVLDDQVLVTTMRTPGHDIELAAGWLVAESGVRRAADIVTMGAFASTGDEAGDDSGDDGVDTVRVHLAAGVLPPRPRAFVTSSACGVCSADVIDAVPEPVHPLHTPGLALVPHELLALLEQMRAAQKAFDRAGALHAAGLVDASGRLLWVREDVGRHNAVDKAIGAALLKDRLPLTDHVLLVSGRVSYEIVQKALAANVAAVVAVSGPTSLAVDLARRFGLVLIGFARDDRMNVYSGAEWMAA